MPKVAPIQNKFTLGEVSPLAYGRVDLEEYKAGMKTCLNAVPLVEGGVTRRPGTVFVKEVKTSANKTRLLEFEFSASVAYVIEAGNLYFRFFTNHARVDSGTPVEVVTPYVTADLFQLKTAQSADVLYIAHPSYAPRKLERVSATSFTLTTIDFLDGPYLNANVTTTTLTPSATTGSGITITASAVTGINDDTGFQSTDVGRLVRIKHSSTWGYAKITAVTDTTHVAADVKSDFGAITASADWRLGSWSDTTGYPSSVCFFEDRLVWGGATATPQRIDASKTGDYENMAPTDTSGVVAADNAIAFSLLSRKINNIRWLMDSAFGLLAGTIGGVWVMRASSLDEAMTPVNVNARRKASRGCADIAPVDAGDKPLFVQRQLRKVRELAYSDKTGFTSPDRTLASSHITLGGLTELTYQEEPYPIIWAVRADGALLGLLYDSDFNAIGWHRHTIGGAFSGGAAVVESVAVIPAPDGLREELWVAVKRTINGSTVRYVEYVEKFYEDGDAQEDSHFVDAGFIYNSTATTTISGLAHLEGETVKVLTDGAKHPDKTVVSGAITLDWSASVVHVGLGYNSDGETLRFEAGSANGTALGKLRRNNFVNFLLHDTGGIKVGPNFSSLQEIPFRTSSDPTATAVPLFRGFKNERWNSGYDTEGYVCWRHDDALPGTMLAVLPDMETQDRG